MNPSEIQLLLTAKDMASGVVRAAAGILASSLVTGLGNVARMAAEDEANTEKLRIAVENTGTAYADLEPIIAARIKQGQDLAFSDDKTRDALAALAATTGSTESALRLLGQAQDLSRAKNMDLTAAAELVGKVAMGNTSILKRYGVVLDEGAGATEALAALQQKFGGQAEAYGNTTKAAIERTKDSIDEWRESVGAALGPAGQYLALLGDMSPAVTAVSGALGLLTPAMWGAVGSFIAAAAPVIAVTVAVVAVGVALYQVWETVSLVRDNWDKFVYALTTGRLNDIPVFGFIFGKIRDLMGFLDGIRQAWDNLTSMFANGISFPKIELPHFASGGVVPGPVGAAVPIIAHAGERIIPVGGGGGGGDVGGGSVNITVYGSVIGITDLESRIRAAVTDGKRAGAFRGVIA